MSYGIEIQNPSGFVKVDETYARYRLYGTGSMTTPGPINYTLTQEPIILVRPSSYGAPLRSGSVYPDKFWVSSGNAGNSPQVSLALAMLTRADLNAVAGGLGINVFNASGSLLFTSLDRFANIDTIINYNLSSGVQDFTVPTPPFGVRYFAMTGPNISRVVWSANYMYLYCQAITLLSETTIRVYEFLFSTSYLPVYMPNNSMLGQPNVIISGYL